LTRAGVSSRSLNRQKFNEAQLSLLWTFSKLKKHHFLFLRAKEKRAVTVKDTWCLCCFRHRHSSLSIRVYLNIWFRNNHFGQLSQRLWWQLKLQMDNPGLQ